MKIIQIVNYVIMIGVTFKMTEYFCNVCTDAGCEMCEDSAEQEGLDFIEKSDVREFE